MGRDRSCAPARSHTIIIIKRIATLVFVLIIVLVHDSGAGAIPSPRRTRLARHDVYVFVFVVGLLRVVDGFFGLAQSCQYRHGCEHLSRK